MAEKALSCKTGSVHLPGSSEWNVLAEWMFLYVSHSDAAVLTARTMKRVLWEMMSRATRRRHRAAFKVQEKTQGGSEFVIRRSVDVSEWRVERKGDELVWSDWRGSARCSVWEYRWVQLAQNRRWMWPGLISLRRHDSTLDFQTPRVDPSSRTWWKLITKERFWAETFIVLLALTFYTKCLDAFVFYICFLNK